MVRAACDKRPSCLLYSPSTLRNWKQLHPTFSRAGDFQRELSSSWSSSAFKKSTNVDKDQRLLLQKNQCQQLLFSGFWVTHAGGRGLDQADQRFLKPKKGELLWG